MSFVNYIFWDPDPIAIHLPIGDFSIAWYGILFALAFLAGYLIMTQLFKKEGVPELVRDKMLLYVVIGTVVGARLGHCLFYDPVAYLSDPISILNIREGGLASHGAAIGLILAMWIFAKRITKRHFLWGLDRLVIIVALSGLFIRSGNLVNQEINGLPTTSGVGFIFPTIDQYKPFLTVRESDTGMDIDMAITENVDTTISGRYSLNRSEDLTNWTPVQEFLILSSRDKNFIQWDDAKQMLYYPRFVVEFNNGWRKRRDGVDSLAYADMKTVPVLEVDKPIKLNDPGISAKGKKLHYQVQNAQGYPYGTSHYVGRHPAQLYEAFAYLVIFFLLLFIFYRRKTKVPEGELFGLFLVLTFSARFVIEFFKEVQEPWEQALPLDMGQILSIPFVTLGAVVLIWVYKRKQKILNPDHEWPKEYFEDKKKKQSKSADAAKKDSKSKSKKK